jgi:hypothetical protein
VHAWSVKKSELIVQPVGGAHAWCCLLATSWPQGMCVSHCWVALFLVPQVLMRGRRHRRRLKPALTLPSFSPCLSVCV